MTSSAITVLVVDDERGHVESLEKIFAREGFSVLVAASGQEALDVVRARRVDVVVTDLMMPSMSGIDLLKAVRTVAPDTEVVVMTAHGTIETAVEAMRLGAYDFVEKPLKRMQIVKAVRKAAEKHALVTENRTLRAEISQLRARTIVGSAPAFRRALEVATQAAPSTATVLIVGESGSGKELFARYMHERSGRSGAFVATNLAALPETIVEAELFGHERGAFTGAVAKREGRLALAEGGTLFLDEIGELAPSVQVKLLRVLQEGEYEPLGGRTRRADFRLIAATHRDLGALVRQGRFREDLYYRLNVIQVACPRLADRREDIPLLVEHFVDVYARKNAKPALKVAPEVIERLLHYDFPGNVRELENLIERAVVLGKDPSMTLADLPPAVLGATSERRELTFAIGTSLEEIERTVIRATLNHTRGDKRLAAQLLGIATRTIYRKLDEAKAPGEADDDSADDRPTE